MRNLSDKKHVLLAKVRKLKLIDPFVKAAYSTTTDEVDALCVSVIELHRQNKFLVELLERSQYSEVPYTNISSDTWGNRKEGENE